MVRFFVKPPSQQQHNPTSISTVVGFDMKLILQTTPATTTQTQQKPTEASDEYMNTNARGRPPVEGWLLPC